MGINRDHKKTHAFISAMALLICSCVPIDPTPEVDAQGNVILEPSPYDEWLVIRNIYPQQRDISPDPIISIEFNDYITVPSYQSLSTIYLVSGGIVVRGSSTYDMISKTIYWKPNISLVPSLEYTLFIDPSGIKSVTESPLLLPDIMPYYYVDETLTAPTSPLAVPITWTNHIKPIFDAHCGTCHGNPGWHLPSLTYDNLVDVKSSQMDRFLVRPYDAPASYLMHKLLPDYHSRRFTIQPPPWAPDVMPLDNDKLRLIQGWINNGAHR